MRSVPSYLVRQLQVQGEDISMTVKANQQTRLHQISSQFRFELKIPCWVTDHALVHGRKITWVLLTRLVTRHICEAGI